MAEDQIFDTHAHLIADDDVAYPPSPLRGTTHVTRMTYTATAEWLIGQMDRNGVGKARRRRLSDSSGSVALMSVDRARS